MFGEVMAVKYYKKSLNHKQSLGCQESNFLKKNDFLIWFHQILGTVPTEAGVNLVPSYLVAQLKEYQLSSLSVSVLSTVIMQMFRERWCSHLSCKKHKNPEGFRDKKNLRFKVKYIISICIPENQANLSFI